MGAPEADIIDQLAALLASGASVTPSQPKPIPPEWHLGPPATPMTDEELFAVLGEVPPTGRRPPLLGSFRPPSIRRGR